MGNTETKYVDNPELVQKIGELSRQQQEAAQQHAVAIAAAAEQAEADRQQAGRHATASALAAKQQEERMAQVQRQMGQQQQELAEANRRMEKERQEIETRIKAERELERQRVHAEKKEEWVRTNREYPIPPHLKEFITGVLDNPDLDAKQDQNYNIAFTGNSGVGKSSLLRVMLESFGASSNKTTPMPSACAEGDGTRLPMAYLLPPTALGGTGTNTRLWDLPGQGTALSPSATYLRDMGLKYFDCVVIVCDGRWSENDQALLNAIKFAEATYCVVRTKTDLAVEDLQHDSQDKSLTVEQGAKLVHSKLVEQLGMQHDPDKVVLASARAGKVAGDAGTCDAIKLAISRRASSKGNK